MLKLTEKKDFDYNQILASKSAKTIANEIFTLYCAETSSASFTEQLKNNLDETPVKNIESIKDGQKHKIEYTFNLVFNELTKFLRAKQSYSGKQSFLNQLLRLLRGGLILSLSESIGSDIGHSIPISGSFQIIPFSFSPE